MWTPGWHLTAHGADVPGKDLGRVRVRKWDTIRLFVKPDDRWDFNEVSDRCPHEVTLMIQALEAFQDAARCEQLDRPIRLPEELLQVQH